METEPKARIHKKRRERLAHRVQPERTDSEAELDGDEVSPARGAKERSRSKPRKKKNVAGTYEEDIIDGFAIVSFKSIEDLEKFTSGKLTHKLNGSSEKNKNKNKRNNSLSPARHKLKPNVKKKDKLSPNVKPKSNNNKKHNNNNNNNSAADNSGESSGETTDNLDTADIILNRPKKPLSRRFSDVSTRSSSGAGYLCDSESGDERVSDTSLSLDIFTTKPLNSTIRGESDIKATFPPVSSLTTTITTACPVTTSSVTDVTLTTVATTTTTSCVTLTPPTAPTTTSVTVTTAQPTVITTASSHLNHHHRHNHSHTQQQQHQQQVSAYQNTHQHPQHHQQKSHNSVPVSHQNSHPHTQSHHHTSSHPHQQPSHQSPHPNTPSHPHQPSLHPNQQSPHPHQQQSLPPNHPTHNHNPQQQQHHHQHGGHHTVVEKYPPHMNHVQKPHHTQQQQPKSHHDRERRPSGSPAIKRRPPTPPLTKPVSKSPPRYKVPTPLSSTSSAVSLAPSLSSSSPATSASVINREPKRSLTPSKTPRREDRPSSRDRESTYQVLPPNLATTKSFFPPGFPSHGAAAPGLYSSLGPSPGLHSHHPLHSSPSHQPPSAATAVPFPGGPHTPAGLASLHPQHPHHPQAAPQTPGVNPHMFAPPLPLGPPAGPLAAAGPAAASPAHIQPEGPLSSLTSPDLLRDELNRRFLASQERSPLGGLQGMPALMRADIHQHMHQHQHQHQHMHQHMYHPPGSGGGGGLGPSVSAAGTPGAPSLVSTSNPYEKLPSTPVFRPGLPHRPGIAEPAPRLLKDKPPTIPPHPRAAASIPGLPGYPSLLLNPSAPDALNSGIPGAFQPKGLSGLHPAVGPMFLPGRELEKPLVQPAIPPSPQASLSTSAKKPGKWCAVHVRIAWEIHHHQQKQGGADKGLGLGSAGESKPPGPADPLRPPSHLLPPPGGALLRPGQDLPNSVATSLLSSGRGGLFDSGSHGGLLNTPASHIGPPFPRPSPYSLGTSLPVPVGNGLPSTSREPTMSAPSVSSHEWNRLSHHRTPPTFQVAPPPWGKMEEREKELERERERERERELSMERSRREEERERERRLVDQERHRFSGLDDRSRERDRFRENELLNKSRSRSRSRSPMRNGRIEHKPERPFDRRIEESANSMMKVKEERRESFTREEELFQERDRMLKNEQEQRERMLKNEYLTSGALRAADPFMQASLAERARMLTPVSPFLGGDRVPPHPSLLYQFDKGPMDFANHRLSLQREMEQTRDQLLNRFPVPGVQATFPGFSLEQERLREEMILRDTERAKREYLERLPMFERERLYYENSKIPGLRPPDGLAMSHLYSRNISPALNHHIKRSSPCVIPGAPPPLIHSGSSSQARGHGSPAVNKTKGVSPTDSVGESKRDSNSNSTDPDAHSR